jgi:ABC-type uncharacterized transport system substrate-binding protein
MRRREFITLLGGVATWPLLARAQRSAAPVIGLLSSVPFETRRDQVLGFRKGLNESGYYEGQNVTIEYRSADNQIDHLPGLAAELVDRRVDVIVTIGGDNPIHAAKDATTTIPVVFVTGFDPVAAGFVNSLNRPGGNLTGVSFLVVYTVAKRLELLSELAPAAGRIGMLVNEKNPNAESTTRDANEAAGRLGKQLVVVRASTESAIARAFATLIQEKVEAILIEADPFFLARREQIVGLTAQNALPAIYAFREFVSLGGLMSYGTSLANAYHQAGIYAGKILQGEKPADLPVVQSVSFELAVNLKTAAALGLKVPLTLQVAADEVIE